MLLCNNNYLYYKWEYVWYAVYRVTGKSSKEPHDKIQAEMQAVILTLPLQLEDDPYLLAFTYLQRYFKS